MILNHTQAYKAKLPAIERIDGGQHRLYRTSQGKIYPSMSSVVGLLAGDSIEQWKRRVGLEEAEKKSRHAATRGTRVHELIESHILADDVRYQALMRTTMPDAAANFKAVRPIINQNLTSIRAVELQMWSDQLRLAGTVDCVGVWDGKLSIIDWKTSGKPKKEEWIKGYFLQTSGYAQMWEERFEEQIQQVVVVIAVDYAPPQVFIKDPAEYLTDLKKLRFDFYKQFAK